MAAAASWREEALTGPGEVASSTADSGCNVLHRPCVVVGQEIADDLHPRHAYHDLHATCDDYGSDEECSIFSGCSSAGCHDEAGGKELGA